MLLDMAASAAAGNAGVPEVVDGFFYGLASGMAICAPIAVYKLVYPTVGTIADVIAARVGINILSWKLIKVFFLAIPNLHFIYSSRMVGMASFLPRQQVHALLQRVVSLSLCSSKDCFIYGSLHRTVLLWDQQAEKCQGLLHVQGRPATAYNDQGHVFAVAFGGYIRLFDARKYEGPFDIFSDGGDVSDANEVKLSNDGRHASDHYGRTYSCAPLIPRHTCSGDGSVYAWSARSGKEGCKLDEFSYRASCHKMGPWKSHVCIGSSELSFWNPDLSKLGAYVGGNGRNLFWSMSYPSIFGYLIPALIGIVGANVQGKTKPLLETHSINILSFLIATAIYCYAHSADLKSRLHLENSSQFWGLVAIVSGSNSAISLVSTFIPRSNIGHFILYTTWIGTAIIVVVFQYGTLFSEACRQLYNETLKPFCIGICNRFRANNTSSTGQLRPTLPV
ncbi:WD REPEATS REGION domain-containing protein [Citrus sinensis]|uniref:WD REPEATS REGION domain-containing protein n=1 Tax=Citrus sinensis TaxID=2711 RepID=A0ACB8K8W1_CITSI|nr:WD REPEATS REGION domain-containing protein [Citrus sinensis]